MAVAIYNFRLLACFAPLMLLNKTSDLDKCVKNSSVNICNCMQYCLASDVGGEHTDGYLTEGQNRHSNFTE